VAGLPGPVAGTSDRADYTPPEVSGGTGLQTESLEGLPLDELLSLRRKLRHNLLVSPLLVAAMAATAPWNVPHYRKDLLIVPDTFPAWLASAILVAVGSAGFFRRTDPFRYLLLAACLATMCWFPIGSLVGLLVFMVLIETGDLYGPDPPSGRDLDLAIARARGGED